MGVVPQQTAQTPPRIHKKYLAKNFFEAQGLKTSETYKSALDILNEYISANNLRKTQERYTILRQICKFPSQFTADQLSTLCAQELTVSRATIYNSLQLFLDSGIIVAHPLYAGSKVTAYELAIRKNNIINFQCTKCGRVVAFENKAIDTAIRGYRYSNFVPANYSVYVFGECKVCRRKPKTK